MEIPGPSMKRPWPFRPREQNSATPSSTSSFGQAGDMANKNTCFGSIIGEQAQLNRHMEPEVLLSRSFAVVREGDYFALQNDGQNFARLTKRISRKLHALDAGPQSRLQVYVSSSALDTTVRPLSIPPLTKLPVEINVYGARGDAEEVGTILSQHGAFLQFPRNGLESSEYYNPHFFRVEGYSDQVPTEPLLTSEDEVEILSHREGGEGQTDDSAAVDSILDSLSHHTISRDIHVDGRIKSTLLPHQKEAIDFISEREIGTVPSKLSLWDYNDVDEHEPFYKHVFTGERRPKQEEAKGGIIADEMGLGKSLVILATIAGSLDQADKFVTSESQLRSTQRLAKAPSKATLILAPSSLLIDNWLNEIRRHTYPASLSIHKHIGRERHKETHLLFQRTIVFTTYATVAKEFSGGNSTLAKIKWFRIVLDEAHDIRNRQTNQFKAVTELSAKHRWCLTGTPIQNGLEDLGALVAFLKVPILERAPTFRKCIMTPAASSSKDRFRNLRILLQSICLRRTQQLLHLQPPVRQVREVCLTPSERQEYNDLLQQGQMEIQMAVSGHIKKRINAIVLNSLLKLRLYCNNGSTNKILSIAPTGLPSDPDEALSCLQQHGGDSCAYCFGMIYSIGGCEDTNGASFMPRCYHLICHNCASQVGAGNSQCPACELGNESTFSELLSLVDSDAHSYSGVPSPHKYPSKLLALLSDIRCNDTHKSIVFSSWKKTLDLVRDLLSSHSIPHDIIHGGCTLTERSNVLESFASSGGPNILLMTLGTGAVGLNLAVASRVYLLEPQWNPSIEAQAIGRAIRLGQTAQVTIVQYVVKDTVEQADVLSRQERKIQLAGGGFRKGKDMPPETLQSLLHVFDADAAAMSHDTMSLNPSFHGPYLGHDGGASSELWLMNEGSWPQ